MLNPRRTLALCAALLAAAPLASQVDPATAEAIRKQGLENSQVMAILDRLTNGIGHRLTGSDSFTRACEWAKQEFEAMGLPKVELEKWDTWPVVWNRGQWSGRIVAPEPIELQVATEAWTNGTKGIVRGSVLPMPSDAAELAALEGRLAGAWLFGSLPSSRDPFRAVLDEASKKAGIAGFLYSSSGDAQYPNRMRVFGSFPRSAEIPTDAPRIMIRNDQADRLREFLKAGQEVVAEFDVRNRWRAGPIDLYNVIAEIPGSEKPDEVVVVCGHLDSWHQATGTTDNGTGSASTLEAARILMAIGAQPKRTIRFCLWGGEEQGLLGSNRHVTMRRTQMEQISAVLNHDTGTNWAQSLTVTDAQFELMQRVVAPLLSLSPPDPDFDGLVFDLRKTAEIRGGGGSDHASFLRAGVPAFAWGLTGRSDYFRHTWHTQWDNFDVAIPEYMRHTSTVIALTALGIADLDQMLPREGIARARGDDLKPQIEGRLGVGLGGANDLVVQSVREGGPGAKMGMQKGDRIVAVQGRDVAQLLDLVRGLRRRSGDEQGPRTLSVQRGDQRVELSWDEGD
jgi:hypothetical protein